MRRKCFNETQYRACRPLCPACGGVRSACPMFLQNLLPRIVRHVERTRAYGFVLLSRCPSMVVLARTASKHVLPQHVRHAERTRAYGFLLWSRGPSVAVLARKASDTHALPQHVRHAERTRAYGFVLWFRGPSVVVLARKASVRERMASFCVLGPGRRQTHTHTHMSYLNMQDMPSVRERMASFCGLGVHRWRCLPGRRQTHMPYLNM